MKIYDVSRLPSSITLGWDGENNWSENDGERRGWDYSFDEGQHTLYGFALVNGEWTFSPSVGGLNRLLSVASGASAAGHPSRAREMRQANSSASPARNSSVAPE